MLAHVGPSHGSAEGGEESYLQRLQHFSEYHTKQLVGLSQSLSEQADVSGREVDSNVVTVLFDNPGSRNLKALSTSIADTLGTHALHYRLLFRVSLCLSSLVNEMQALIYEADQSLLPPLALYGEDDDSHSEEASPGRLFCFLKHLQCVWAWAQRVQAVVLHVVRQLAALYSRTHESGMYYAYLQIRFMCVWDNLADLLGAVVSVEEVIEHKEALHTDVDTAREILSQLPTKGSGLNEEVSCCSPDTLEQCRRLLIKMEREVLDGGLLQRVVLQPFDLPESSIVVTSNGCLRAEFEHVALGMIAHTTERANAFISTISECRRVGTLGFGFLYVHLFHDTAKMSALQNVCRGLFALDKESPVVYLRGTFSLCPSLWLARHLPEHLQASIENPEREAMEKIVRACERIRSDFDSTLAQIREAVLSWAVEMDTLKPRGAMDAELCDAASHLLHKGVQLARTLQLAVTQLIALHQCADIPMTLPLIDGVVQGVELLAMIRSVYHNKTTVIARIFHFLLRSTTYIMEKHLYALSLQQAEDCSANAETLSMTRSATHVAIALLHRPHTLENLTCLSIVLDLILSRRALSHDNLLSASVISKHGDGILRAFAQLRSIIGYQRAVSLSTNCDFLWWHRQYICPLAFRRLYRDPHLATHLPYLLAALQIACPTIALIQHTENSQMVLASYIDFVRCCFRMEVIDPLCTDVENNLRWCTSAIELETPPRQLSPSRPAVDLTLLIQLGRLRFFNEWVDIRHEVENYLDAQFYNMCAMVSHAWDVYEEMRCLALARYGLFISGDCLSGGTEDRGLDVLVITENIHTFITNYTYNMTEQLFVQRPSSTSSRRLHTLNVRQVAQSIHAHGTGIMHTAVNYVYRCLLAKLSIVSHFLHDDHVKSRLTKEVAYFQQLKGRLHGVYPHTRAQRFRTEIAQLGETADGEDFLHRFCRLIAEIGNALGYMRIVRSGGLHIVAEAAHFIPVGWHPCNQSAHATEPKPSRTAPLGETGAHPQTGSYVERNNEAHARQSACATTAIDVVDRIVHHMHTKLTGGSDYFRVLIAAIRQRLKGSAKYEHLKLFHMIVPPMCLLFVERMVQGKERMIVKESDGVFTDDGFALGCSFLLTLFSVYDRFDTLHWFSGIRTYLQHKQESIECVLSNQAPDSVTGFTSSETQPVRTHNQSHHSEAVDVRDLYLSASVIHSALKEHTALEEAFICSRVFFYSATSEDGDDSSASSTEE